MSAECPVCGKPMKRTEIQGVRSYSCSDCGGTWLGKGALNAILHPEGWDVEYCTTEHGGNAPPSDKKCPECGDSTLRSGRFLEYSSIAVDYCPTCGGIWLDRCELDDMAREIEELRHTPESWQYKVMVFLSKLPF